MSTVTDKIEYMEWYAEEYDIPIMQKDSLEYISNIIKENNYKSILELGTAIGYSTICMASVRDDINVTSIERNEERYNEAIKNIKDINYDNRVSVIFDDALNVNIDSIYDMLIIDAAKSQNRRFLDKFKNNIKDSGIIIIDNLDFHGYVGKSSEIKSRNLRQMVRKIEKFLDYLDNQDEFDVEYIEVGDRICVCKRRNF